MKQKFCIDNCHINPELTSALNQNYLVDHAPAVQGTNTSFPSKFQYSAFLH